MGKKEIILVAVALILISDAHASDLLIRTLSTGGNISFMDISAIEKNNYYLSYYSENLVKDSSGYTIRLLKEGKVLREVIPDYLTHHILPLDEEILLADTIQAEKGGMIVAERKLGFCNSNGICEPCLDAICETNENELTCQDCAGSMLDGYCNVKNDGYCDPDCVAYIYDSPTEEEGCFEETLFSMPCEAIGLGSCKESEWCDGTKVFSDNYECCSGDCRQNERVDYYPELPLDSKGKEERENLSWVFVLAGIIISIILAGYYIWKKKIITISLISIVLFSGAMLINNSFTGSTGTKDGIGSITGMATYQEGQLLKSRVTFYYTPYDEDFPSWCSLTGKCFETTQQMKEFYGSSIYECIDERRGGWCCIPMKDRGFYEEVNCAGDGLIKIGNEFKRIYYKQSQLPVQITKEATLKILENQPFYNVPVPRKTVACPEEFPKGTKFYIDYGVNTKTGCYECNDRGAAVFIAGDGTVKLDLYTGIGKKTFEEAAKNLPNQPNVYYGCSGKEDSPPGQQQPETPPEKTPVPDFSDSEIISLFPEVFKYNQNSNNNLLVALKAISSEFSKKNVPFSANILAASIITLEKEVGTNFLPVEEYGDYCSGPGCTYKVGGSCRSSEYDGGCDYKGRGWIQITHKSNYAKYCGEDCLSTARDECECVGKAYCTNKECAPSKALIPEVAARIFVSYYIDRGLVEYSNNEKFYDVGYRINGGTAYAQDFSQRASAKLLEIKNNPRLGDLMAHLNSLESGYETDIQKKDIPSAGKLGYYFLNPSFRAQEKFNLSIYSVLSAKAKALVKNVEGCTGTLSRCVMENLPSGWEFSCSGFSNMCKFDVDTKESLSLFNENTGRVEETPVIIKFALSFPNRKKEIACDPEKFSVLLFGDSITAGASAYDYLSQEFNAYPDFNGKVTMKYSGIVSESAHGSVSRIETALDENNPDIVLLWHGMNQGGGAADYKASYSQVIQAVIGRGKIPVIITPPNVCSENRKSWESYFEGLSAAVSALESEFKGKLYVIDLWSHMKSESESGKSCESWYTLNGNPDLEYHPDREGHLLIAKYIAASFQAWQEAEDSPLICNEQPAIPPVQGASSLNCPIDSNLAYFTVGDYTPEGVEPWRWRYYSRCTEGQNSNVVKYLNEAFQKYPRLSELGQTHLLLMMQCFAESKCDHSVNYQGFCQVVVCPSEYPRCHENSEEGKRENILAAAKELDGVMQNLVAFKNSYSLTDRQMVELMLFTYNRGIGTVYGFNYRGSYLKGVKDYLNEGQSFEDAMLNSCYGVYAAGVYGTCGGSREWCCRDVGGLSYVKGIIYEYENWLCPTVKVLTA